MTIVYEFSRAQHTRARRQNDLQFIISKLDAVVDELDPLKDDFDIKGILATIELTLEKLEESVYE